MRGRDPCLCGSGKKYRECCRGKRPRETGIVFRVAEDTTVDGVLLGPEGRIALTYRGTPVPFSTAAAEVSYARPKGRKVLVRASHDPAQPTINPNAPLFTYHAVYGVDTNTRTIRGTRTSVGCVLRLILTNVATGHVVASDVPVAAVELHNVVGDPERVVWRLVCESLIADPQFRPGLKIALVVDSSLDEIECFNQRRSPVLDDWHLPDGFTLIYASSDSASASVANRFVAACDRGARKLLSRLERDPSIRNLHSGLPGEPWSHIRNWTWNAAAG